MVTNMNKEKIINGLKWFLKSYLWLIPLLIIIDYVTKVVCFDTKVNITIINNFLFFKLHGNTGAAWSILEDHPEILAIISVLASIVMIIYIVKSYNKTKLPHRIAVYLILAGTMGNMIDRCFQFVPGTRYYNFGVIDFISFKFGTYYFPIFNIADSSLVIGVILLMLLMVIEEVLVYVYKNKIEVLKPQFVEIIQKTENEEIKTSYNQLLENITTSLAKENSTNIKTYYNQMLGIVNSFEEEKNGK